MERHQVEHQTPPSFWRSRYAVGLIIFSAIAGYYLLTEHLAHVVGALPLLFLLACLLMHVFMHHDHGQHHNGGDPSNADVSQSDPSRRANTP